jgi:prolyl oligopeptidase
VYFSFANYITPSTIYKLDPETGNSEVYKKPVISFNSDEYESLQVFYKSKDGTRIPMIITKKKRTLLNGKNPTILYGYGGFNLSETPVFSIPVALWLEMSGIYAVANIRGGGEYGEKWHLAGTKMNKQNVFDDFIAASEYLIEKKYTSPDFLAIRGGSNGGLLVGAVMTQRPDLMKVALPAVGVMDMLRYHSFKFAAQLQAKQTGNNPVLIRIETKAGHGAGTPVSKSIEQYADILGFTLYNLGIKNLK